MPKITIMSDRRGTTALVTLVEVSATDGIFLPVCTGDHLDLCPSAGFDPTVGDTFSDLAACIDAAQAHVAAHEHRVCAICQTPTSPIVYQTDVRGERFGRVACPVCKWVEVVR